MPKYREDLLLPAFRIAEAIRANDWSVVPPKVRVDYFPIFGYYVLEIRRAFQIRLPFLTTSLREEVGRRRNRLTVPVSYLCMRWVTLRGDSPLWYLTQLPLLEQRIEKGVFYNVGEGRWKILTYQVVEDMSHLRRMFIYIFANYQRELVRRQSTQQWVEKQLLESAVFDSSLSLASRVEMERFEDWVGRRLEDMGRITGRLSPRADLVTYYAERTRSVLYGVAATLSASATNLARGVRFNPENFRTHLRKERGKLDQIVSRNIISLRRQAQYRISKAIGAAETEEFDKSAAYILEAVVKLRQAAREMENWSSSLPREEAEAAVLYRLGITTSTLIL